MQNQKLNYKIPYPMLLHIEENQIYQEPARKEEDSDEEQ